MQKKGVTEKQARKKRKEREKERSEKWKERSLRAASFFLLLAGAFLLSTPRTASIHTLFCQKELFEIERVSEWASEKTMARHMSSPFVHLKEPYAWWCCRERESCSTYSYKMMRTSSSHALKGCSIYTPCMQHTPASYRIAYRMSNCHYR